MQKLLPAAGLALALALPLTAAADTAADIQALRKEIETVCTLAACAVLGAVTFPRSSRPLVRARVPIRDRDR
jgi:hypothetical protein